MSHEIMFIELKLRGIFISLFFEEDFMRVKPQNLVPTKNKLIYSISVLHRYTLHDKLIFK